MAKPADQKKEENTERKPTSTSRDQELKDAAERVYRHYGSDLGAFRRDVQRELVKRGR